MNKDFPVVQHIHDSAESVEIIRHWRFEIHRDVQIAHAQASHDATLCGESIVRTWQRKIDDCLETSFAKQFELTFLRLPASAQPLMYRQIIEDFVQ
jgi:hypothetical protein